MKDSRAVTRAEGEIVIDRILGNESRIRANREHGPTRLIASGWADRRRQGRMKNLAYQIPASPLATLLTQPKGRLELDRWTSLFSDSFTKLTRIK